MGALHRFYLPPGSWQDDALVLRGDEARHCSRVLRHREGDEIEVFQGEGRSAVARIRRMGRDEVELETLRVERCAPLPLEVVLAPAIPKGKTMDWLVQKAVEIGVTRIEPLLTERTVVHIGPGEAKAEKWRRVALEACKQCGRNWLPRVEEAVGWDDFLDRGDRGRDRMLAAALTPEAKRLREWLRDWGETPAGLALVVGPEGDFTPGELDRLRGVGASFLSLGPSVLRAETAAIYGLSIISQEFY